VEVHPATFSRWNAWLQALPLDAGARVSYSENGAKGNPWTWVLLGPLQRSGTGRVEALVPGATWIVAEAVGLRDSLRVTFVERPTEAEEDVVIATEADMDAWSALTRIDGSLIVSGSELIALDGLPQLREVTGNVTIRGNARLSVVKLPLVQTGGLVLADNPALEAARFPSLRTPGMVSVGGSPAMTQLALPVVEIVTRYSLSGLALERVVAPPIDVSAPNQSPTAEIRLVDMSELRNVVVWGPPSSRRWCWRTTRVWSRSPFPGSNV